MLILALLLSITVVALNVVISIHAYAKYQVTKRMRASQEYFASLSSRHIL